MGYVEDLLASNETIVYESRKHWVAPLFSTVTGTLLAAGGLVAAIWSFFATDGFWTNVLRWGGLLALLVGLVMLVQAFVQWWSEHYIVTNQKVLKVDGIVRKTAEGSALEKINDITISQSLLGRWLEFGTLRVATASDESDLRYTMMRQPVQFRRAVLDQKQAFEQADARAIAEAVRQSTPPAATAPAATPPVRPVGPATNADEVAAAIATLAEMHAAGHITDAEFASKKEELLGRL